MTRMPALVTLATLAATAAVAAGAPRLVVESPAIDAGVVAKGDAVEAVFVVRNAGDAELAILSAKPS